MTLNALLMTAMADGLTIRYSLGCIVDPLELPIACELFVLFDQTSVTTLPPSPYRTISPTLRILVAIFVLPIDHITCCTRDQILPGSIRQLGPVISSLLASRSVTVCDDSRKLSHFGCCPWQKHVLTEAIHLAVRLLMPKSLSVPRLFSTTARF